MPQIFIVASIISFGLMLLRNIKLILSLIVLIIVGSFGYLLYTNGFDVPAAFEGVASPVKSSFVWVKAIFIKSGGILKDFFDGFL